MMTVIANKFRLTVLLLSLMLGFATGAAIAQDEEEAAAEGEEGGDPAAAMGKGTIYLPIKPSFVVNYGGAGRLKYIKAEMSVRLADSSAANSVRHHLPYIRNNLVMLLSSQTDESVSSQQGREQLRESAREEIQQIIKEEDGREDGVMGVYFTTFIVQK